MGQGYCQRIPYLESLTHILMKHIFLSALLLACFFLPAQDYRPFLPGKIHYYTASNSNFSVRVDAVGLIAPDSAFWMNPVIGQACFGSSSFPYYFRDDKEGRMGDHFIQGADGAFRVVSRTGDTLTLHTRLPIATPWPFLTGSSLTATLQSRTAATTFGQADSVLTIQVSDGNSYTLSQHFGLLVGINFSAYFSLQGATLCQLARIPNTLPHAADYVAWQPGDAFTYVKDRGMQLGKFNNYVVRNRWANAVGDTLWLEVDHQFTLTIPPNMDTIAYAVALDTLRYTDDDIYLARLATGELDSTHQPIQVASHWDDAVNFGGALRHHYQRYPLVAPYIYEDSCGWSAPVAPPCDDPYPAQIVEGFGLVRKEYVIGQNMVLCFTDIEELLCYQRGTDSIVCPAWLELATGLPSPGIQGSLQVAGSASGQPRLVWEGLVPGDYRISLCELQGRVLHSQTAYLRGAGSQDIPLPGPAGIYLLRVEDLVGGGNWVVRLPKFMH
jgi:hypothetical protein